MRLINSLKNSVFMYVRLIFSAASSIIGISLLYRSLGNELFGYLSLIIASIAFVNFINIALSTTAQRFLAISTDDDYSNDGLNNLVNLNFVLTSVFLFIILKLIGWTYLEKIFETSNAIKYLSKSFDILVISACITNLHSVIIVRLVASENFKLFAKVSVIDALVKLLITYVVYISPTFNIEEYSIGLLINSIFILCIYTANIKSVGRPIIDTSIPSYKLINKFFRFYFWTLFGSASSSIRIQGITLCLGAFFEAGVVSARALGNQAANSSRTLSQNLNVVLYPSILKGFNLKELDRWELLHTSCKLTYYLTFLIVCPVIFFSNDLLHIWLGSFTQQTKAFVSLMLIEVLIFSVSLPLTSVARASERISEYELRLGLSQFALLPVSVFFLLMTNEPTSVLYCAIFTNIYMFWQRLIFLQKNMGLSLRNFNKNVLVPILKFTIPTILTIIIIKGFKINLLFSSLVFFTLSLYIFYKVGLSVSERTMIKSILKFDKITKNAA
ncbi:hypothetical protein N9532_05645 [Amylibacter sp.]|nr:hypothetical protein [Amylibacter sp.]